MTKDNKNRVIAVAVTVVVHAAVLAILLLLALTTPLPLPGEAGVEVNLGMYNQGMGVQQQPKPKPVVNTPKPQPQQPKEETVTQDTEEAPAIEEPKPKKKEEPKVNERALFKPVNKPEEQPSSEGNTQTPGDQGSTNGTPDANSYDGQGGSGGGISYSLGGRGSKNLSHPKIKELEEAGVIVVNIWVDPNGLVKDTQIGKGTTITNTRLRNIALNAAQNSVFNPDKNAVELQKGTITYTFTFETEQ